MSSKKKQGNGKSSAKRKELEKNLSTLRGQLTRTKNKLTKERDRSDRWKDEAKAQRLSASRAGARAEKLQQKLDRATKAMAPMRATSPIDAAASGRPAGEPTTAEGLTVPDKTWTVVQLRAEARARHLKGMSNEPKAKLLAALA